MYYVQLLFSILQFKPRSSDTVTAQQNSLYSNRTKSSPFERNTNCIFERHIYILRVRRFEVKGVSEWEMISAREKIIGIYRQKN